MNYYPLELTILPGAWRIFSARRVDAAFFSFRDQVFRRDNYTCQYCGFQARLFQEVVNLDLKYTNNKLSNLVTACCFCTQCFFLEAVGMGEYGGGTLIYLPEMSQPTLNGLCHVLFCAISNATDYRTDAQNIYRSLKMRSQVVEEKLGEAMSDPVILARMLIDTSLENREALQNNILKHLRLLPSRTRFIKQIEAWANAALEELAE
jgi:intracellular multiplication protein IcmJ